MFTKRTYVADKSERRDLIASDSKNFVSIKIIDSKNLAETDNGNFI